MIVSVGYAGDFKQIGTIRIKDGQLVYDLPPKYLRMFPTMSEDAQVGMRLIQGRFANSSTVLLQEEPVDTEKDAAS